MATKKRMVDDKCCIFNKEWGEKYFFVETNNQKASCLICNESVAVMKEYNIRRHYEAKHLSTHSKYSGKLQSEKFESIKQELGENIQLQIHEKAKKLLWYFLAMDLSSMSQLLVFIRGVNCNFEIIEEMVSVRSIHGTTTGDGIFIQVQKTLQNYNLQWNQLWCVTVDGRKNMAGMRKSLLGQIQVGGASTSEGSVHTLHYTSANALRKTLRYFLHTKTGYNCEMDSNFCDLPYYTKVRWLSWGKVLFHFYNLRREIDLFLTKKNRADPQLSDPSWLSKLSFLVDITSHMNELNLKLQGKNNLVCDLYRIITAFWRKLSFVFKSFAQKKIIWDLNKHFSQRFSDLDRIENEILFFENPFGCNLDNMPTELQLELTDLQANTLLKEKHREGKLIEFYHYLPADEFSKLKKFASGIASIFGTTYVYRTRFTDEYLKAILMVGYSNHKANVDDILEAKRQFHKSC
uniref:SPIN-DOC-like zinc-finger domain-containing protein n=1 Tax=Octopus bimaculoides TaxID=37653 RepID=A0A0L8FTS6_OCTBM